MNGFTNGFTNGITNGTTATVDPSIQLPHNFKIHEVDQKYFGPQGHDKQKAPVEDAPLGVLSNFTGTFKGTGFNLIFRPNNSKKGTPFSGLSPPIPNPPNENVLELNLTRETLTFSPSIGNVPNRGLGDQADITLNGVPYVQSISDVANPDTGRADGPDIPIHFEPGLWMHVPSTDDDPVLGETLCRMASIPHGTTINAQCLAPTTVFNGPPHFEKADPTPFPIGNTDPKAKIRFASQTLTNENTPRIPQNLSKFNAAGTITQYILDDPNQVLAKAIASQKIVKTIVFKVATQSIIPKLSAVEPEGLSNIAFLEGDPNAIQTVSLLKGPNAVAADMQATFWIETVEKTIKIPPWRPGQPPIHYAEAGTPTFCITPPKEIHEPRDIAVQWTQIQYSQTVLLNFATLSWPHISVATLNPTGYIVPQVQW